MSDRELTVSEWEAVLVHIGTGGKYAETAAELVRRGWTDEEIQDVIYPALSGIQKRLLDGEIIHAREEHYGRLIAEYDQLITEARAERRQGPERPGTITTFPRPPGPDPDNYLPFDVIEAKRRELAESGRSHGYEALGGKGPTHPFPGQRSTIVRRYKGRTPPGAAIPGICDKAPPHQH